MSKASLQSLLAHFFGNEPNQKGQFRDVSASHVVNSDGYEVKFNRNRVMYSDSNNSEYVESEFLAGGTIVLYRSATLSNEAKPRIEKALQFMGVSYEFN